MEVSQNCIELIKKFEGLRLEGYYCPAHVPTIGFGSTMYQDGRKVKIGDILTLQEAEALLVWELQTKGKAMPKLNLNQNQYDAVMSFVFNLGLGAFKGSTLYKKININSTDPLIRTEFSKWNKARVNGALIELKGLTNRRKAEADLYFKV
jgi:lysozyme